MSNQIKILQIKSCAQCCWNQPHHENGMDCCAKMDWAIEYETGVYFPKWCPLSDHIPKQPHPDCVDHGGEGCQRVKIKESK